MKKLRPGTTIMDMVSESVEKDQVTVRDRITMKEKWGVVIPPKKFRTQAPASVEAGGI